ncbi:low molecular weight protein-tyrosine-phosphatase [Zhihengliuella alba]|uniref:protein-tyrosine-phosphatase n=1 Tax=Zhihengliuella alba TaxID=547018 RepID=A0ABP7DFI5_9MICC
MFRITAVCTGNICRSPMAEYLIRTELEAAGVDGVVVSSSAVSEWEIGNPIDARAGALLDRQGIDTTGHVARQFDASDFERTDLVLALDTDHYAALRQLAPSPEDAEKVRMLRSFDPDVSEAGLSAQGIYDPWFGDEGDFETAHRLIMAAMPGLIQYIRSSARPADS